MSIQGRTARLGCAKKTLEGCRACFIDLLWSLIFRRRIRRVRVGWVCDEYESLESALLTRFGK